MQKVRCPKCTAEFNADTSRAHQELGKLKCAWCKHIFDDPGPDETSEPLPEIGETSHKIETEPLPEREKFRVESVFEICLDQAISLSPEEWLKKVQSALVNSTACEAIATSIGGTVTLLGEPRLLVPESQLTSIESDGDTCPECDRLVGTAHATYCGKRVVGADIVMPEDCEGEA